MRLSDNVSKRILIVGCAGSGTTLMRRLFYGFRGVELVTVGSSKNIEETSLEAFIKYKSDSPVLVGKRVKATIFSTDTLGKQALEKQAGIIRKRKILVVNMIRDGRDVILSTVTSKKIPVTPRRWIHSMRHRRMYPDLIAYEAKYEDVIRSPMRIQSEMAAKLGLTILCNWDTYPDFVPAKEFKMRGSGRDKRYGARRLSNARIGKDPKAYLTIIKKPLLVRHFEKELELAGYL